MASAVNRAGKQIDPGRPLRPSDDDIRAIRDVILVRLRRQWMSFHQIGVRVASDQQQADFGTRVTERDEADLSGRATRRSRPA
jgi:hypothetical protein